MCMCCLFYMLSLTQSCWDKEVCKSCRGFHCSFVFLAGGVCLSGTAMSWCLQNSVISFHVSFQLSSLLSFSKYTFRLQLWCRCFEVLLWATLITFKMLWKIIQGGIEQDEKGRLVPLTTFHVAHLDLWNTTWWQCNVILLQTHFATYMPNVCHWAAQSLFALDPKLSACR